MDLATRALDGTVEPAGGVYGVSTMPGFTRKGIATALMSKAHQYFEEKDYRFSFLLTSRALVAHALYLRLAYVDLIEFPSAYKAFRAEKSRPHGTEKRSGFDIDKMLRIHGKFSVAKTGFVVRDKAYMRMLKKVERIKATQCLISEDGYVIFREEKSGICIRELIALNAKEANRLMDLIEKRTKGFVYDRAVLDEALFAVYRSRGYTVQGKSHSVLMLKLLDPDASFKNTYGDRLYLSRLDTF
jgi:predicted acetyltransferase